MCDGFSTLKIRQCEMHNHAGHPFPKERFQKLVLLTRNREHHQRPFGCQQRVKLIRQQSDQLLIGKQDVDVIEQQQRRLVSVNVVE